MEPLLPQLAHTENMKSDIKRIALTAWAVCFLAAGLYVWWQGLTPVEILVSLEAVFTYPVWGGLLFVALFAVRALVLFPPSLFALAGGAFFGPIWGTVLSLIGACAGSALSYYIGSLLSGVREEQSLPPILSPLEGLKENSFMKLLLLHLLHAPLDLVSYGSGFLRIHFKKFLKATAIGTLPGFLTATTAGAASGLESGDLSFQPGLFLVSAALLGVTLAVAEWIRGRYAASPRATSEGIPGIEMIS